MGGLEGFPNSRLWGKEFICSTNEHLHVTAQILILMSLAIEGIILQYTALTAYARQRPQKPKVYACYYTIFRAMRN